MRVLFLGNAASALRATNQLERGFGSLGRVAATAGKVLAFGVVGGLAASVKAAVDFDKAMRNVNSIAKVSEGQFKSLQKQVLALSKTTGQAPKTLAEGLYDIVSSGFNASDGLKILNASAKAATAGLTDTATSTKAVVAVLNAYHQGADQAAHVSDVLFQTVNKGVLTFDELASQIGDVLPVAAQLNVPLEDIGGALATITLHGVNAAEASTQLKQLLVSILKPSVDLGKAIRAMGFETGEAALKALGLEGFLKRLTVASHGSAAAFADWFPNVRAMNGALGLTGKNIETLHKNLEAMRSSQGATQAAFAEQGKSIAVQWQRAKASLTAAAIPIGQLLFPALEKAAELMGRFAQSISAHTPEIRAAFGGIAQVIGDIGRQLSSFAGSQGGQSALVGLLATLATVKTVGGARNIIAGISTAMAALGPAGTIAAVAAGALAAAWYAATTQGNRFEDQIRGVEDALKHQQSAAQSHRQALNALEQAHINASTSARQAEAAEVLYARAVREGGKGSEEAKAAYDNLRQAKLNAKTASEDLTTATRQERQTRAEANKSVRDSSRAWAEFRDKAEEARHKVFGLNVELKGNNAVSQYAAAVETLAGKLGVGAGKAHEYSVAVGTLVAQLGRLPTFKEVRIYVAYTEAVNVIRTVTQRIGAALQGHLPPRRAMGGFIPGATGAAVPILAHAGEIILNPQQQAMLGGPRYLSQLFGFTGPRGGRFAAGGIVANPTWPMRPPDVPHRPGGAPRRVTVTARRHPFTRRQRTLIGVRNANAEVAALFRLIGQRDYQEELGERQYQNMDSIFQIEEGNLDFILTDSQTGLETVNYDAVAKRQSDLSALMAKRNALIAIYMDEVDKRRQYLEALNKAIQALIDAIRAQQERIQQEQQAILTLRGEIRGELTKAHPTGPVSEHTIGVGPNRAAITRWSNEIVLHQKNIANAQEIIRNLTSDLTDYRGRRLEEPHNIGFANQDVADQQTLLLGLQSELASVNVGAFEAQVRQDNQNLNQAEGFGGTGGEDAFGGQDVADAGGELDQQLRDFFLGQIAQLKLALGIQNLQLPIIGQFHRGTLHVPHTGAYLLEAGEQVLTAGHPRKDEGPRFLGPPVQIHIDSAMGWLRDFVRVEAADVAGDAAVVYIGKEADRRLREGR